MLQFFVQIIILSMHVLPQMNAMLDFICMGSVDLLVPSGTRTHIIEVHNQSLYLLSKPGLMKALLSKRPLYIHVH